MQIHQKLQAMRKCKGWTQENLAEKLDWPISSYRKIERGEASIKLEKLQQIAEVMGVKVEDLVNSDDKTVMNFAENCYSNLQNNGYIVLSETQCAHELEKAHLIIELHQKEMALKDKELAMQSREIAYLKELLEMSKKLTGKHHASHSNNQ